MVVEPLGEESLGVRSMSLYVETEDVRLIVDPGASLAPLRFGLPPHPREFDALRAFRERLRRVVQRAEYLFISHYHRDHFTPPYSSIYMGTGDKDYEEVYGGKVVFAKDHGSVNPSQARRGIGLFKAVKGIVKRWVMCDGVSLTINETNIVFSKPIPHGKPGSRTGYVVGLAVVRGEDSLVYLPDVQGPLSSEALEFALSIRPKVVIVGGFPAYLIGKPFTENDLKTANENLLKLWNAIRPHKLVVAHHLLRLVNWRDYLPKGISVETYSSLIGLSENLLEARRRELYDMENPGRDYMLRFSRARESDDEN